MESGKEVNGPPPRASFDIDGVLNMGAYPGVYPGPNDVIITGRSVQERTETQAFLDKKGLSNEVFYNPILFDMKTRASSGRFKGEMLQMLNTNGYNIVIHYEDDPIQAEEIKKIVPEVQVVLLMHDLTEKENVRHELY